MQTAETERLLLREFSVDDAEALYEIYSEPVNMKFMGKPPASLEIEREQIRKHIVNYYEKRGFGLWAVILKETSELIGRCGFLYQEIEGVKELEIGYLIECRHWGKGFATESALEIVRLGFEKYSFSRIIAVIHPENTASIRVAEKIGMKYEKKVVYKDFGEVLLYVINSSKQLK